MARHFIFFDVGGTLLHARPSYGHVLASALREHGIDVDVARADAVVGEAMASVGTALGTKYPHPFDLEKNRLWYRSFFDEFLARLSIDADLEDAARELWERHRAGRWLEPADDAVATLAELRASGHRMAVISNWDDTLPAILERLGLLGFFEFAVVSADRRMAKPDIRIFLHALERAGVAPEDAVHVGDDPVMDALGAKAVGIRPILIGGRTVHEDGGDIVRIAALSELPALLLSLEDE